MIYFMDYSILVFGFSVNKRVPMDFLRFAFTGGAVVLSLLISVRLLRPRVDSMPMLQRHHGFWARLLFSFVITFALAVCIFGFWLATEL